MPTLGTICHTAIFILLVVTLAETLGDASSASKSKDQEPRIMVGILARNTAHTLSNFLGYLENLDYPKDKMLIWIRTCHGIDNTPSMLSDWADNARQVYASVSLAHEEGEGLEDDRNVFEMTEESYRSQVQLRQQGLDQARQLGVDYLLWMDCDNFLVNNQTLRLLMEQHKPLVAPMLESGSKQAFSNFWCGQNEKGYYKRTPDYLPTLRRERVGCFQVLVIYGTVLIDLRSQDSLRLAYWPTPEGFTGPVDEVVQFAYSAKKEGVGMFVLNTEMFGYIVRPEQFERLDQYIKHYVHFKLQTLVNHPPVLSSLYLSRPSPPKEKVGLDKIFMISLERRPERRNRMLACLDQLNLDFTLFNAVDGKQLNQSYLDGLGISYLPGWKDPWGERPMTFGEVGCFLSHFFIWQQMLEDNLEEVLVLEDDIDFEPNFRENLQLVLSEARKLTPTWDLIYVGRKILNGDSEVLVDGATSLVVPQYSYWTLGYLVSLRGARKLLAAKPLQNLLPVDEYLPILFDVHPEREWASRFPDRHLAAYSTYPLLVNPTHYVGDAGWYSDTEPPIEVLQEIRRRKLNEEKEEKKTKTRQEKIKEEALKRQIETMKQKLKPKTEL